MKYVFLTAEEANALDFSEVGEESVDKLRFSLEGTQTFVRYEGTQPFSLLGKQEYTQEEVANLMSGPEWTSEEIV